MSLHPILSYADPDAALAFLERAFGFTEHAVHRNEDGTVGHAEVRAGGGVVMFGASRPERRGGGWTYVAVDEVDALHERARAAGAEITMEPTDQDYGSRDFAALDPEGNEWSFGTYSP